MMTRNDAPSTNSDSTCRQTPQGVHQPAGLPFGPPTTAIASNSVSPSLTAFTTAVRSAQIDGETVLNVTEYTAVLPR